MWWKVKTNSQNTDCIKKQCAERSVEPLLDGCSFHPITQPLPRTARQDRKTEAAALGTKTRGMLRWRGETERGYGTLRSWEMRIGETGAGFNWPKISKCMMKREMKGWACLEKGQKWGAWGVSVQSRNQVYAPLLCPTGILRFHSLTLHFTLPLDILKRSHWLVKLS